MKYVIFGILLALSINTYSQNNSCEELMDFIKTKGYYSTSLSNYTMDSSWLRKVTKYTYEYKNYIIAEIKESEYSYSTKKYIFCEIPDSNWRSFQNGGYGDSYGERFWKYIKDYQCNCD